MMAKLFNDQTSAGVSQSSESQGSFASLLAKGTWGGALLAVEVSPDAGTTWLTTDVQLTSDGIKNFISGRGVTYRLVLTGTTGTTNVNAWLTYQS